MSKIIAVAAPIGGGKTSFVKAIAQRLNDAATIFYDHYEKATGQPVHNLIQWMKNGADFNDFIIPGLAGDLKKLKQGESVTDPATFLEIPSKKFTVLEMPLGKAHRDTAKFIDLLIWIEVPMDIALARKIKEFAENFMGEDKQEVCREHMHWINQYLDNYLNVVRHVLHLQVKRVSADADIILDGQGNFKDMAKYAVKEIQKRFP